MSAAEERQLRAAEDRQRCGAEERQPRAAEERQLHGAEQRQPRAEQWHAGAAGATEGVIKFAHHREGEALEAAGLGAHALSLALADLRGWRTLLWKLQLIGQDPRRYLGLGYGNVSVRVPPYDAPRGARRFLVTGTQTSGRPALAPSDLCVITTYDLRASRVTYVGGTAPSSESMTHAAVYDADATIRCTMHVHAPELWQASVAMALPIIRPSVAYGTAELAAEVQRLVAARAGASGGLFALAGHADGLVAFGVTAAAAAAELLPAVARVWGSDAALPGLA